jgi:5-methylcytosine-specific restriction endonuclease McrA
MTDKPDGWLSRREYAVWLRCEKYGAPYGRVNRAKVFRDSKWTCGLCGRPVNSRLRYPNPMSASLDHIVPLSVGPDGPGHVQSNCQLAHFHCNSSVGAKRNG